MAREYGAKDRRFIVEVALKSVLARCLQFVRSSRAGKLLKGQNVPKLVGEISGGID